MLTGRDVKAERVRLGMKQAEFVAAAKGLEMKIDIKTLISIESNDWKLAQEDYQKLIDAAKKMAPVQ